MLFVHIGKLEHAIRLDQMTVAMLKTRDKNLLELVIRLPICWHMEEVYAVEEERLGGEVHGNRMFLGNDRRKILVRKENIISSW